jgi:hypothetical protein
VPGCKPHCDMGVVEVARVPVSRKQTRMLAVMVSATDMSGHVGVLFMAWLEIMGELAATTKVVDMMLHAVSLGRLASIDCWVQPTRIVAHLSAVVRAPFASTLDCPGPSFPLVFFRWCRQVPIVSHDAGAIARKLCIVVV